MKLTAFAALFASVLIGCASPPPPAATSTASAPDHEAEKDVIVAIKAKDVARLERWLAQDPKLAAARDAKGRSAVLVALFQMKSKEEGDGFLSPQSNRMLASLLAHHPPLDRLEAAAVGDPQRVAREAEKDAAYVRFVSSNGWMPLHYAAFAGNTRTAEVLLDHGAPLEAIAANEFKNTPLQVALLTQQEEVARLLVKRGANVNFRQHGDFTALHEACFGGNASIVAMLLGAGADPSARATDGTTPLGIARKHQRKEIEALLLEKGALP